MKLGILRTGAPPRRAAQFGSYPEMFRKLPSFDNTERIPVPAQPQ